MTDEPLEAAEKALAERVKALQKAKQRLARGRRDLAKNKRPVALLKKLVADLQALPPVPAGPDLAQLVDRLCPAAAPASGRLSEGLPDTAASGGRGGQTTSTAGQ